MEENQEADHAVVRLRNDAADQRGVLALAAQDQRGVLALVAVLPPRRKVAEENREAGRGRDAVPNPRPPGAALRGARDPKKDPGAELRNAKQRILATRCSHSQAGKFS